MIFEVDLRSQTTAVVGVAHFSCTAARVFAVLSDPSSWGVSDVPRITSSSSPNKIVFSFGGELRATALVSSWHNSLCTLEVIIDGYLDETTRIEQENYWEQISKVLASRLNGPEILVASSPGKVNIFFAVGSLFKNGFHEVASCYQGLSLRERVAVELSGSFSIDFAGPFAGLSERLVPKDQSNLVYKAALALASEGTSINPDLISFWIHKSVPIAGGMAGGSADAAAALVALNELSKAGMQGQLAEIASKLGSDVPFSLHGGTAIGLGKGEKLSQIECPVALHWVMTPSALGLATPDVYHKLDVLRVEAGVNVSKLEQPIIPNELIAGLGAGNAKAVAEHMHNDLEIAALELRPELADTIEQGRKAGALRSMVSGSGPTIAHLAKDRVHAEQIANRLSSVGLPSIATFTSATGTYLES